MCWTLHGHCCIVFQRNTTRIRRAQIPRLLLLRAPDPLVRTACLVPRVCVSRVRHGPCRFSIFNSFMMVVFLCGLVALILMRSLRADYGASSHAMLGRGIVRLCACVCGAGGGRLGVCVRVQFFLLHEGHSAPVVMHRVLLTGGVDAAKYMVDDDESGTGGATDRPAGDESGWKQARDTARRSRAPHVSTCVCRPRCRFTATCGGRRRRCRCSPHCWAPARSWS